MEQFRNFCIIAHIDHGKSPLANRLLWRRTGHVSIGEMTMNQILTTIRWNRSAGHHHQTPCNPNGLPGQKRQGLHLEPD